MTKNFIFKRKIGRASSQLNISTKSKPWVRALLGTGVSWVEMHCLSQRVLLEEMKAGGLLTGDASDMMKSHLGAVFMPCGMGHFLGLDVHDVGGYPKVRCTKQLWVGLFVNLFSVVNNNVSPFRFGYGKRELA